MARPPRALAIPTAVEKPAFFFSYLLAGRLFCPRLLTDSLPFATLRPDFFRHSAGSSSPSTGAFPFPARSRMRKVSERPARPPRSRKYSSVRKAETFSATATLMSWFRATPSSSAAFLNSSSSEGCNRNAKLLRLMASTPNLLERRRRQNYSAVELLASVGEIALIERHDCAGASVNCGLQNRVVVRIGQPWPPSESKPNGPCYAAMSSRTRPTSSVLNLLAAKCCALVSTASYSSMSGTESNNSNCRSKAASKSWREAPRSLRNAATITSVSST
jgi:hypothetical protein